MRTPAAAIAWEFRQRHRWGLVALLATPLALGAIKIALLAKQAHVEMNDETFALLIPIPLAATFLYMLAVFTFGISGDLAARESMYPPRMFTLPVSSGVLAGLPMLYGCVAMTLMWFAMRMAGTFPSGIAVPKYWPALFAASLLAWTQALTWMPYPFRGARIVISIALLVSIDVVVFTALENKARESTMLLMLAPLVPLAYLTARSAVRRARRGEVGRWDIAQRAPRAFARSATPREFKSAARAQLWFEWRQFGRSLPTLVAIVLPVALSLLFLFRDTPAIVVEIVIASLLVPPFMAIFVAATAGKSSANASQSYGITPFVATRPLEDRGLVVAKWKAALLSTMAAWAILIIAIPLALKWSGAAQPIIEIGHNVDDVLGRSRTIMLGLLILLVLVGTTWKQLVQGLYIAMSGRDWAVKGIAFGTLALVTVGVFALGWIFSNRSRGALFLYAIPWVMVAFLVLKFLLAMMIMKRGRGAGTFTRKQLIIGAILWDVCVFAVYGVLAFILPEILVRRHFLMIIAMLVVPFVRVTAAPLAVARNRHP